MFIEIFGSKELKVVYKHLLLADDINPKAMQQIRVAFFLPIFLGFFLGLMIAYIPTHQNYIRPSKEIQIASLSVLISLFSAWAVYDVIRKNIIPYTIGTLKDAIIDKCLIEAGRSRIRTMCFVYTYTNDFGDQIKGSALFNYKAIKSCPKEGQNIKISIHPTNPKISVPWLAELVSIHCLSRAYSQNILSKKEV